MKNYLLPIALVLIVISTPSLLPSGSGEGYIYSSNGGLMVVGGDSKPIELVNNNYAANPTYEELLAFLSTDTTNTLSYVLGGPEAFICSDFAEQLHNNAEAAGIRAGWVNIDFADSNLGHTINVFETTDRGLVFIDCTGGLLKTWNGDNYIYETDNMGSYSDPTKWDTIAYLVVGEAYGHIGISEAESLEYDFYLEYIGRWDAYYTLLAEYNNEVLLYNQAINGKTFIVGSEDLVEIQEWESEIIAIGQTLTGMSDELDGYYYLPSDIVADYTIYW
jgi:hypothetical protein